MSKFVNEVAQALEEVTARIADGERLARGRRYFRRGDVADLEVRPGTVSAKVMGRNSDYHQVSIACRHANENERQAARASVTSAVPRPIDLAFTCVCMDWGDPCAHGVAVFLEFAREVDSDQSLLLSWRSICDQVRPSIVHSKSLPDFSDSFVGSPGETLRELLGDALADPSDLLPTEQVDEPIELLEFFSGAMEPGTNPVVLPSGRTRLDVYSDQTIEIDQIDVRPVLAGAIDTICSYWSNK